MCSHKQKKTTAATIPTSNKTVPDTSHIDPIMQSSNPLTYENITHYDYLVKTVIIGDSGVGKSCLLKRFSDNEFIGNHISTIGVDFEIRTVRLHGKQAKLQIWDTAGQERFHNITTSYYRGAHSILLVYDVTCRESFEHVKRWYRDIQTYAADDVRILLIANKSDLDNTRMISHEEGQELAKELGIPFLETSAKTAANVEQAFLLLAKNYVEDRINNLIRDETDPFSLPNSKPIPTKSSLFSCCTFM